MGIRDKAREILNEVPPLGQQINSVGPTAAKFTRLTGGVTHATLKANWDSGGIMTTCNAFTGWYAGQLGSKSYLGRFDLDTYLPKIGKSDAWIKSTADNRPKFGDICRHASFHVGVSLDFDGDVWNRCDSGQGGKGVGYDVIKRIRGTGPYDPKKLVGWVDIEIYFGEGSSPSQTTNPVPEWLPGWWYVSWRNQPYYYYFDRSNKVKWTQVKPKDPNQPVTAANDTGAVTVENPTAISIRWGNTGSIEKLSLLGGGRMSGTWNGKEPLSASRI